MITAEYIRTMAEYSVWQNNSVFGAADSLDDDERRQDRGAFFGSIHGTLNHLLWGDQIWMSRFAGTQEPKSPTIPGSVDQIADWGQLKRERRAFDGLIVNWMGEVEQNWLHGTLTGFQSRRTAKSVHRLDCSSPIWSIIRLIIAGRQTQC